MFLDLPPFFTVLFSTIMIWAYMWKLIPGLDNDPNTEEYTFVESFQASVGLLFGNVPEPEDGETTYTWIRFAFSFFGFSLIVVILLNFLIAVIGDTYGRISEDRELYDAKELLGFIRDFDSFLLKINFAVKWEQKRFVSMVKEEGDDQFQALQNDLEEKLKVIDEKMVELGDKVKHVQDTLDNNSLNMERKLSVLMRVLDPEGKVNQQLEEEALRLRRPPTLKTEGTII